MLLVFHIAQCTCLFQITQECEEAAVRAAVFSVAVLIRPLMHIVITCRTSQHGGEAAQVGAAAPSVAEALDALKVPRAVKKTN